MPPCRRPQARETLLRAGAGVQVKGRCRRRWLLLHRGAVGEPNAVLINHLISGLDRRHDARYLEMTAVCAAIAEKRTVLHL